MDCCSAGHSDAHAENNPEKKGISLFALIMILLMVSLLIFSILK